MCSVDRRCILSRVPYEGVPLPCVMVCSLYPLPCPSSLSAWAVATEALNSKKKLEAFVIQYFFIG